ncbi:MAG: bifunctional serine/threonine-protein kinase/formylglycine-generating enzyme family protein [Desulfobacterales bacterium]|nr:bifunctional serine/threonine-protein kinase/formylglycine-generating enzyme family protein [Desulfobacterales bacterium]
MTMHSQSAPSSLLEEGMVIKGKWEILSFVARGGKGEVYLARQMNLNRQVALKIMSQAFLQSLEGDEDEIESELKRFHREVQIMARMQHPNIINVHDFDQLSINGMDMDYIVMEYIPGPTLRQKMPHEGLGQDEFRVKNWIATYFLPILSGMQAVHDKGVVHRDMKPENVLIGDGQPKIMDFGIAGGYNLDNVTQTHHMIGTISYMPEEQFINLSLTDARVDVYALGKILYEVVEGKMEKGRDKPFKHVALSRPQTLFFKRLDRCIRQATAQDRNQRVASVKSFREDLEALMAEEQPRPHRTLKPWLLAGFSVLAILVLVLFFHFSPFGLEHLNGLKPVNQQPVTESVDNPGVGFKEAEFQFDTSLPTAQPDGEVPLPKELVASDNMTMILVPGGNFNMPQEHPDANGIPFRQNVKAFYMDKTKVTNYLYVQFLEDLQGVEVKRGSVFWKGNLLLLLGKISEKYEPILYENGRFRVKPEDVAKPVVRVTPMGAWAYASFYGKQLPSTSQWWYVVRNGLMPGAPVAFGEHESVGLGTNIGSVNHTKANRFGIKGLKQNVHEWTFTRSTKGGAEFYIHGLDNTESYLVRQPWEAFSNVGFRTVLKVEVAP